MGTVEIKKATIYDIESLVEFAKQTFITTYKPYIEIDLLNNFTETHFNLQKVSKELENSQITFLLAFVGTDLVGYSKLIRMNAPNEEPDPIQKLFIEKVYVSEIRQGLGVGKKIISHISSMAIKESLKSIWLKVWEGNLNARQFYQKTRFQKIGEAPFQMGHRKFNDHVLELRLT